MQEVVSIKFNNEGKEYYFGFNNQKVEVNDMVIVESNNVQEIVKVIAIKQIDETSFQEELKPIIRKANKDDLRKLEYLHNKEKNVLVTAKQIINKHNLEMDLIKVHYSFDSAKITFIYTAEGRVDFRELIKDFASTFKAKVELRQIGVRDEAKMCGGLGPCGKEVCCKQFLNDFGKVNIKMAKNQNLTLNPNSISGLCGRLMCCLAFENDHYAETMKIMPKMGSKVLTKQGEGTVVYNDLLKRKVTVRFTTGEEVKDDEFELAEIKFEKNGEYERN